MERSHSQTQYRMYVKREQHSHLGDYSSWEERAFAEDAARILGGNMWPQRSYSCTFCTRDFKSAQALGGHMNIHQRDRARLKQQNHLSPHHKNHHFIIKSLLGNNKLHFSSAPEISTQLDCGLTHHACYSSSPATTITTTRLFSCISSTQDQNCGHHNFSPSSSNSCSSSIILGHVGSPNSEQEGVVKARDYKFNGLGCSNYVETSLSVGLTSMFGQNSSSPTTVPCGDRSNNSCKRLRSSIVSSLPLFPKPCSNDKSSAFQPVVHGTVEDLDLELRLGKRNRNLSS
ncbi:hypothetical protein AAZX31_02G234400 [Glycine max]|uniref:C2H2-type domain-containing protein n=2 Tax=Glycine subgen. Soja TaxID=1462606 RepID=A0A0R0L1G6_SOYBN|nr:zinc finger protein 10 [Glycine max]XP_028190917.1 zinc finger protein 10-like [Glycine soja]KAG5052983.1 hypothetical protein JHK87_005181 [Glycine soja]KAG5064326.1 hypothetical protein JHK85_005509 [Glycine max]KAG5081280.1 hypothetical protein JHK86_005345 [Glycine max]KAH1061981.1 hypothetical protein GYH30_005139 [Glycine max]KAH1263219.1 Zinc finger protein 10 [Glycine max]|eukprot:XP_006576100.1 zinc finger protein 10 [Glycine max]